jgi:hypothetical protein
MASLNTRESGDPDARSLFLHDPPRRRGRDELGFHGDAHRPDEIVQRHVGQRNVLPVLEADGVARHIQRARPAHEVVHTVVHSLRIECVDFGGFRLATSGDDLGSQCLDGTELASGDEYRRAFPCQRPRHRASQ